jgi:hypothetical protein
MKETLKLSQLTMKSPMPVDGSIRELGMFETGMGQVTTLN